MPTNSILHNIVIEDKESAEKLVDALEKAEAFSKENEPTPSANEISSSNKIFYSLIINDFKGVVKMKHKYCRKCNRKAHYIGYNMAYCRCCYKKIFGIWED